MRFSWRDHFPDQAVGSIANEIDQNGFAVVPNYLSGSELSQLQQFAEKIVGSETQTGNFARILKNTELVKGTILDELTHAAQFKSLCKRLSDAGLGKCGPEFDIYRVVRFLKGAAGQQASGIFHYDSFVITGLLPIVIPNESGNLLLMKPTRKIRRWYFSNLLDKLLVGNKFSQKLLYRLVHSGSKHIISLRLVPGNMYFFWGYRSIHTNEPVAPEKLRATALFHYGDPHATNTIRTKLRNWRGLSSNG